MNRDEKTAVIDDLAERLGDAEAIFAVDYRGISVPQAAELRTKLRESDASFKVVKNRLAKLAAAKAGTDDLDALLTGPIALTLISGDPVVVAKTITTFGREHDILEYRGGVMDGAPLDSEGFQAIARLPGLDVLHGQLVGLTASPLTGLVAGLSNLISGLGRQLAQIAEQGLVTGEAPAERVAEAPEPTPPVEEPVPDAPPVEEPTPDEPAPEPEAAEDASAASDAQETSQETETTDETQEDEDRG
ncbi:MAG: 50S ribosomal protein L10 [Actinomycetota bacterium]|nr:50S ribosomal protein L10 [Actinomycetota bacterium]